MNKENSYTIPVFRLQLVKEAEAEAKPITSPEVLAEQLTVLAHADREQMICMHLNTKNRPISQQTVSIGTLNQAIVSPREVFKAAFLSNAHSIILAHNHVSCDVTPSIEDDGITQRIGKAGRLLGVPLLDHIILSPTGKYYSYSELKPFLLEGGGGLLKPHGFCE